MLSNESNNINNHALSHKLKLACNHNRVLVGRTVRSYVPWHLNRSSTLLRFVLLYFIYFSSIFFVFCLCCSVLPILSLFYLLRSSVFPLFSLGFFFSTLSTTYWSYLRNMLRPSFILSFTNLPIQLKNSNLTTTVWIKRRHNILSYITYIQFINL